MIRCSVPETNPVDALRIVAGQPFAHLLAGGALASHGWGGDWQVLAAAPATTVEVRQQQLFRDGVRLGSTADLDPFEILDEMLRARRLPASADDRLPPFLSGALGHVSYEMATQLEPSLELPGADGGHMAFGFYDAVAAWQRDNSQMEIFARDAAAAARLRALLTGTPGPRSAAAQHESRDFAVSSSRTRDQYTADIRRCIAEIRAGEIFQANLTRRLSAVLPALPDSGVSEVFMQLLQASAASFAALLQYEGTSFISNSPERFFTVRHIDDCWRVIAEPVKGTRPRHADPHKDREVADELANDEKERAENIMIADLVRNDLSRVCRDHSIREEEICALRSYAGVHHLVSRISGELSPAATPVDVLRACFPCGSITGAPKIRAMQIIAELERQPRGLYCGSIGFIDDRGIADFSVAIRTATARRSGAGIELSYGSGGGITVLSDPQAEYMETETKAGPFHELLDLLGGGKGATDDPDHR